MNTRLFGEIYIQKDKVICFENGIIGFPDYKEYALIYDSEKKDKKGVSWLQCLEDEVFALPVIDPLSVKPDYAPDIDEELLKPLGELNAENTYVLVTLTATGKKEDITVNLKAPIIINTDNLRGEQIIVEDEVQTRFPIYDILKSRKEKAGE